jgi:hypothetical protein
MEKKSWRKNSFSFDGEYEGKKKRWRQGQTRRKDGGGYGTDLELVAVEEKKRGKKRKEERRGKKRGKKRKEEGKKKRRREGQKCHCPAPQLTCPDTNPLNTCHVTNYPPPQQNFVIRMKSQMINNYRDKMGGLVSSGTKIQMTPNYRDEKHILPKI